MYFARAKRPDKNLYPADLKQRALVDQWSYWQAIHLGPPMQAVAFERVSKQAFKMGEGVEEIAVAKLKETEGFLPVLEKALAGNDWLVGTLSLGRQTPQEGGAIAPTARLLTPPPSKAWVPGAQPPDNA